MEIDHDKTARSRLRLSGGTELAYVTAGDTSNPGLLLLHGYASSSRTFRDVIPALSRVAHVVAPDLPDTENPILFPRLRLQHSATPSPSCCTISESGSVSSICTIERTRYRGKPSR